MEDNTVEQFLLNNQWVLYCSMILPMIGLLPLYYYKNSHPTNLVLLAAWTVTLSISVGFICRHEQLHSL